MSGLKLSSQCAKLAQVNWGQDEFSTASVEALNRSLDSDSQISKAKRFKPNQPKDEVRAAAQRTAGSTKLNVSTAKDVVPGVNSVATSNNSRSLGTAASSSSSSSSLAIVNSGKIAPSDSRTLVGANSSLGQAGNIFNSKATGIQQAKTKSNLEIRNSFAKRLQISYELPASSIAPVTNSAYKSCFESANRLIAEEIGTSLIPLDSENKAYVFFRRFLVCGRQNSVADTSCRTRDSGRSGRAQPMSIKLTAGAV